jgi:hypothetical protein
VATWRRGAGGGRLGTLRAERYTLTLGRPPRIRWRWRPNRGFDKSGTLRRDETAGGAGPRRHRLAARERVRVSNSCQPRSGERNAAGWGTQHHAGRDGGHHLGASVPSKRRRDNSTPGAQGWHGRDDTSARAGGPARFGACMTVGMSPSMSNWRRQGRKQQQRTASDRRPPIAAAGSTRTAGTSDASYCKGGRSLRTTRLALSFY